MGKEEVPMTLKGKLALDSELGNLIKVERENIKRAIAEARAHGDLKENAEYHSAKEKQGMIEGRIRLLQDRIGRARVVDPQTIKSEKIIFGATVTIFHVEKDRSIVYQIVGENEADIDKNLIAYSGPLGRALIGREEGDSVIVKAPKGDIEYEIESIEYL